MEKKFARTAAELRPLAVGHGAAIASDRILVDGMPVGYMYREDPRDEHDSGWAFLAGDEDDAYLDEPSNHSIYDVNTIANYDPEIIPLLEAPPGSAFMRTEQGFVPDPEGIPYRDC